MFILTAFVSTLILGHYFVSGHPHGECAVTKFISGHCGSTATIKNEIPRIEIGGEEAGPTEYVIDASQTSVCFEVVGGDCENPVVDILYIGDFNEDNDYFNLSYNGGDPVGCHGGEWCRSWGSCPAASALVTQLVWTQDSLHRFQVVDHSEESGPCWSGEAEGSFMILEVTVTCDEASCLIDELDECFCSSEIAASQNNTLQALEGCFCTEEITESTESVTATVQTSQSETVQALTATIQTSHSQTLEAIMAKLDNLDAKINILLQDGTSSSEESGSAEVMAAKTMMNDHDGMVEGNDDSSKVIHFRLGSSYEFSVFVTVLVVVLFVVIGGYWFYAKCKK